MIILIQIRNGYLVLEKINNTSTQTGTVGTSVDERELDSSNYQYAREVDNELQLARILMLPQRICHTKRNSELINSILGLPKNMNNAGK
ncbi:hypothetical protein HCN44_004014 [Aphidius gifuensis]|uniref:Uncharacterized protein n=1 Tax=Aphidius gifuensis TaxID=684658 RepID=A0A834XXX7_APHGI|nr:hypothetical protein HCN44_004014 [Aphidius gifuensis]